MKALLKRALAIALLALALTAQAAEQGGAIRYVGQQRYDLKPLLDWLAMPPVLRDATTRPLTQWVELRGFQPQFVTNGWAVGQAQPPPARRTVWIAVRNYRMGRADRLVYQLGTSVPIPVGMGSLSALAFDAGTLTPQR